jgi:hypothetical protein
LEIAACSKKYYIRWWLPANPARRTKGAANELTSPSRTSYIHFHLRSGAGLRKQRQTSLHREQKGLAMNKKKKSSFKFDVGKEKLTTEFLDKRAALLPATSRNGENSVEFNKYIVVYSNNVTGNLSSPWRAGCTSIDCYKDDKFVGVISFYQTAEKMHGGYIDGNGVIVVEYPIGEFEDVMLVLRSFTNLYLLFVEKDLAGTRLAHPVGAVMTFQKKPIGA